MSSSDAAAGPGSSPGLVPIATVRPALQSLILAHTFLILLLPLFFALFFYSTPLTRRRPTFILNALTLLLALSLGIVLDAAVIYDILFPQVKLPPTMFIASGAIGIFQSILVDVILLMRLVAVYPPTQVGMRRFVRVTFLPVILKVVRVTNVVVFLVIITNVLGNSTNGTNPFAVYYASPNLKIEWVTQIVDNAYASILFLRSIYFTKEASDEQFGDSQATAPYTLAHRLRALFRIAVSNFVIPTMFSLVLLIVSFRDVSGDYVGDIVYVNSMVSTYGVVFATVWVGMDGQRRDLEARKRPSNSDMCTIKGFMHNTFGAGARHSGMHPTPSSSFSLGVASQGDRLELDACPQGDGTSDISSLDLESHQAPLTES